MGLVEVGQRSHEHSEKFRGAQVLPESIGEDLGHAEERRSVGIIMRWRNKVGQSCLGTRAWRRLARGVTGVDKSGDRRGVA